jgi:hypothetical protein
MTQEVEIKIQGSIGSCQGMRKKKSKPFLNVGMLDDLFL